jgi:hypothetical protein
MGKRLVPTGRYVKASLVYSWENLKSGCSLKVGKREESLLCELFNLLRLDSYVRQITLVDCVILDWGLGVYFESLDVVKKRFITQF